MSARAEAVPDCIEAEGLALEKRTPAEREERFVMAGLVAEDKDGIERASDTM